MNRTVLLSIFILIFVNTHFVKATNLEVAIYSEEATWLEGIISLEHFLDWKGLSHQRISSDDINNGILTEGFKVVIFPGGYAYDYKVDLNAKGEKNIKAFINNGGGYLGICAGAFLATASVLWEGIKYNYPLDLFQGTAIGSIKEIQPWDGYKMTTISLNKNNEINKFQKEKLKTLYYGGPYFEPSLNQAVDTIATWDEYLNKLAIISFKYGSGNVILSAPHPEIEENHIRDGSQFGNELIDECSEWGWLWSAFDKLLNREISDSTLKTFIADSNNDKVDLQLICDKNSEFLYSHNFNQLHIQLFSIEGNLVFEADFTNRINITSLSPGLYIYKIRSDKIHKINKLIIAR